MPARKINSYITRLAIMHEIKSEYEDEKYIK